MTPAPAAEPVKGQWREIALASLACGAYVSSFYIIGNLTMLSAGSAALVAVVLILPIVLIALGANLALQLAKLPRHAGLAAAVLIGLYLLLMLRTPVFNIPEVMAFRARLSGVVWIVVHAAYFVGLAALFGLLFRSHLGKLAAILAVMTAVACLPALRIGLSDTVRHEDTGFRDIKLDRRPNIHFILADSFSSFAYMQGQGIDVEGFKTGLQERGFRIYEDTFANYHSTTDSLLSMLEMQHHYYRYSQKLAEVTRSAREVIGGDNNLVSFLKDNGYRVQYIHQGAYLLFQGCTVDECYPSDHESHYYAGARSVLREVLPRFVVRRLVNKEWENPPISVMQQQIVDLAPTGPGSGGPRFQYIHVYALGHASNSLVGRCDEQKEIAKYARNVASVVPEIESMVDGIIQRDPGAVIILSGDHGPFISNRCERYVDIGSPAEYRDRVGSLAAIRWPEGYDGRFDGRIKTNVNLFRYVLASLVDGSTGALGGRVPDDVYVHGTGRILKVLDDGRVLVPPVEFAKEAGSDAQ